MRETATATSNRCVHPGQTCEQHRRAVRQQQQHGHQQVGEAEGYLGGTSARQN